MLTILHRVEILSCTLQMRDEGFEFQKSSNYLLRTYNWRKTLDLFHSKPVLFPLCCYNNYYLGWICPLGLRRVFQRRGHWVPGESDQSTRIISSLRLSPLHWGACMVTTNSFMASLHTNVPVLYKCGQRRLFFKAKGLIAVGKFTVSPLKPLSGSVLSHLLWGKKLYFP